ncbi:MAG: hypothetical protein AB1467_03735 [Candidatus Diapherotrites archaeon]
MEKLRALLLISGGFDSPVAGLLAAKKGLEIYCVHFSQVPFADNTAEEKAFKLAKLIKAKKFFVVEAGNAFAELSKKCDYKYYFILMKRLMLKVSEQLALKNSCSALITGESLGQVSSQTLSNLAVIDSAVRIPVLRPLIGFDKEEIIDIARENELYDVSVGRELCDTLGPKHPATKSEQKFILEEEKKVNLKGIVEGLSESARERILDLST